MTARPSIERLHRQLDEYPPLAPGTPPVRLPRSSYALSRQQAGRLATGGCLYGGQSAAFWAPLRGLLHLTNGPVGCGVYAQANRPQASDPDGASTFSGLNLTTDFQEPDVVFGGDRKLARAIAEADELFPLHQGLTVLSTCPVALIGDDLDTVARSEAQRLGKPIVPVHCAGFRRGDGIGQTHATITRTWAEWAASRPEPERHGVTLLCREAGGAWRGIKRLLSDLGLQVSTWPAGSSKEEVGHLGHGRLTVSVGMEYWARLLQRQFGLSWVEADFLGAGATCDSLRAIAAHFGESVRERAEAIIAAQAPAARAVEEGSRARLEGRLYFSFAPLQPRDVRAFKALGVRVGSSLQGWPDREGHWRMPRVRRRAQELTWAEVRALLDEAQPDVVDGLGDWC